MKRLLSATAVAALAVLATATGCGTTESPAGPLPTAPPATGAIGGSSTGPQPTSTAVGNSSGSGNGSGGGSGSGSGAGQAAWPSPEDCITYNPSNLTSTYEAGVWTINDGNIHVMRLHGQPDSNLGTKGLALAKRWKSHCFIGRNNHRDERYSYIFDYWRNSSGISTTIPDQDNDCSSYNRNNITVDDMGDGAYRVKDHDHVLHGFDTKQDANNGKLVLSKYNRICFIGDDSDSDNEGQELVDYML
jgi:hypothetical protein